MKGRFYSHFYLQLKKISKKYTIKKPSTFAKSTYGEIR